MSLLLACVLAMSGDLAWLGAVHDEHHAALHTATRRFVRPGHCDIWVVGVVHLGDASYYESLDELLKESDVVVFEAVMPEGAVPPGGDSQHARVGSTRASLEVLAQSAAGAPRPESIEALARAQLESHRPSVNVLLGLRRDAWGNPVQIVNADEGAAFRSLGSDGQPGGDGSASDIEVRIPAEAGADAGTLQRSLAQGLRLQFQLNNLPYEQANWVPGDISAEELERRLTGENVAGDGDQGLGGMLTGTSVTGEFAVSVIRMLPSLDRFSGGRAIDGLRMILIEALSNEDLLNKGMSMYGEQFEKVILHDRNEVAVQVTLKQAAQRGPTESVAVLYGAAHMPGIDAGLRRQGWTPVETRWLPAISVDLAKSKLTPADIKAVRSWADMAGSMFGQ